MRDLEFSEKRITRDIRKTISSAVANAENNFSMILISWLLKKHIVEKNYYEKI